jgi:hypothetical protein
VDRSPGDGSGSSLPSRRAMIAVRICSKNAGRSPSFVELSAHTFAQSSARPSPHDAKRARLPLQILGATRLRVCFRLHQPFSNSSGSSPELQRSPSVRQSTDIRTGNSRSPSRIDERHQPRYIVAALADVGSDPSLLDSALSDTYAKPASGHCRLQAHHAGDLAARHSPAVAWSNTRASRRLGVYTRISCPLFGS